MAITRTKTYSLLVAAVLWSGTAIALAADKINSILIPVMENAQVFADFTDYLPAVLNYFTLATEQQVIDFYQQSFGEPITQERKRDRLTLTYQQEQQIMRVVISQQNNKRQVDVMIELGDEQ
ncbi:MAG: hypothetical protein JKY81_07080 [Colwellia sp.]|nr:hypothetical protein [Colwellia sp.]